MKKYLALLALGLSCQVHAVSYYFSDCGPGAVSSCVPGSDSSATPTNPATPLLSMAEAFNRFRNAQPGDKILFAKGGSFNVVGENLIQNTNPANVGNPIILDSYQPSWYSGAAKPILNQTSATVLLEFSDGGVPESDGGYIVRNLALKGGGSKGPGHWAIFINQNAHDIVLDNLTIDGFDIGVFCGDFIENIQLKNSTLSNLKNQGLLWGCSHSKVENNTFDNTGFGHTFLTHAMYFGNGTSGNVSGNTLTNTAHFSGQLQDDPTVYDGTRCIGVPIVGHGQIHDLIVENNKVTEKVKSGGGCWGIALDGGYGDKEPGEGFHNIVIRGNKVVNVGNTGIGCSSCDNVTIENNVLVWEFTEDPTAIAVPDRVAGSNDDPTTNVTIRNNSIFVKQGGSGTVAIKTAEQGNFVVSSNLIYFASTTSANAQCFDTSNRTISNFTNFSNNLCFRSGGARFSQAYATQAAAQAADTRWNKNGLIVNPKLVTTPQASNGYVMHLEAISPAVNAGNPAYCSPTVFDGTARTPPCDIGAYER